MTYAENLFVTILVAFIAILPEVKYSIVHLMVMEAVSLYSLCGQTSLLVILTRKLQHSQHSQLKPPHHIKTNNVNKPVVGRLHER